MIVHPQFAVVNKYKCQGSKKRQTKKTVVPGAHFPGNQPNVFRDGMRSEASFNLRFLQVWTSSHLDALLMSLEKLLGPFSSPFPLPSLLIFSFLMDRLPLQLHCPASNQLTTNYYTKLPHPREAPGAGDPTCPHRKITIGDLWAMHCSETVSQASSLRERLLVTACSLGFLLIIAFK